MASGRANSGRADRPTHLKPPSGSRDFAIHTSLPCMRSPACRCGCNASRAIFSTWPLVRSGKVTPRSRWSLGAGRARSAYASKSRASSTYVTWPCPGSHRSWPAHCRSATAKNASHGHPGGGPARNASGAAGGAGRCGPAPSCPHG